MSKRMLINYVLLVLILIFSWIGIKYPITEDQLINRNAITILKEKNITDIKIETLDATIVLKKQGLNWVIQSPVQWFANNIAAERLTTLVSVEPHSTLPSNQIDISTLGLRFPKAVVTLNNKSIYLGDTNQIGNRRYLMVDSNVYLADDNHYVFIRDGLTGLLDNRLLPSQLELKELQFSDFKLQKSNSGWTSNDQKASTENINQLIKNWQQKQGLIKPYDKSIIPLNKVKAILQTSEEIDFFVLAIEPEIIIARPDLNIQYHFTDHDYYNLLSLKKPVEAISE